MTSIKNAQSLNPKCEPLTPEKLRELSGVDLPDEEVAEVIESIRRYARILFKIMNQQRQITNEEIKPDVE